MRKREKRGCANGINRNVGVAACIGRDGRKRRWPSQRKCLKKIMYDVLTWIPYIHCSNSCITHNPKVVSARLSSRKHNKLPCGCFELRWTWKNLWRDPFNPIKAKDVSICWLIDCWDVQWARQRVGGRLGRKMCRCQGAVSRVTRFTKELAVYFRG